MSIAAKLRRAPLRATTGAFILNSGLSKFEADDETAKTLHSLASGTYPFLAKVPPKVFVKALAAGEVALGGALLLPIIPAGVAGLGLTGFSSGLLGIYWKTPGMHSEGLPRPTMQGTPIAKDFWMFGVGTSLVVDALLTESRATGIEARANARAAVKAEAKAARRAAKRSARAARRHAAHVLPS